MPTKRKKPTKPSKRAKPQKRIPTLRGADLVNVVIAKQPVPAPVPLPQAALGKITFGGAPLPPSLLRWLAYDTSWLGLHGAQPAFGAMTVDELAEGRFPGLGEAFSVFAEVLPGRCFALPLAGAEEQAAFLYAGKADAAGEYPVFVIDTDDEPCIALATPGFDVHVARQFGVIPQVAYYGDLTKVAPDLVPSLAWHAKNNFGGKQMIAVGSLQSSKA
jgi:hypothetical protein